MLLQQCLPFTVLKHGNAVVTLDLRDGTVATVLTVYGIETEKAVETKDAEIEASCNSAYRLRY